MGKKKIYFISLFAALLLIFLDQITKYAAIVHLKGKQAVVLLKNVFELQYLENQGAAFGIFQGKIVVFTIVTIVFLLVLCWFFYRLPQENRFFALRVVTILLFAGAIGNMIDRIRYNYVVDFFYFKLIDFPIFNVADIYVTVSCVVLILLIFFYYKEADLEQIFPTKKEKQK